MGGILKKILLVEDEALIALNQARILQPHGFEVVTVYTGENAVETIRKDPEISLVLMDVDLGAGIDGTEAARQILAVRELPVIFLTGHGEKEYVDRVRRITRYGYVLKNSGEFVLLQAIQMANELFNAKMEAQHHLEESLESNREMEGRETRLQHVNRVLLSLRGINHVITRETDRTRILDQACQVMIETSGYHRVWVVLVKDGVPAAPFYHAGFDGRFSSMTSYLRGGQVPFCARRAMEENSLVIVDARGEECRDCPFYDSYPMAEGEIKETVSMSLPLRHEEELYGWINVILPDVYSRSSDEHRLFEEIAGDLAYALYGLKLVDEKQAAERVLKESEEKYRNLVENAPIGIFQTDTKGHALHVNPTMARMVGAADPKEAVAHFQHLARQLYVRPERRQVFLDLLKRDGFVENFEYEARQEDGSRRWFSMNARVSRELEPGNFMIEGFTTDISRQKKLKETLEESERRLRIILEKLPVPALLSSGQLEKVDFINAKFIEVFGYTLEDMPDVHHWWRLAYPDEDYRKKVASEWEENLRRARSEGRELDPVSVQVTCKDGTERFVVIRAYTLGEIHTVVFQDFTDKEMTRKKLEQSVAEKDSLMQELNHRVKNNLLMITSLLSLKEAAMGGSADLSDVRYQIEAIRIIHDKLFHTGSVLEIEIGSYLRDLLNLIFSSFSEKKVRLRIDIEEMRIKTRTAIPLGLIVNEIATNAVKYGFTTAEEPGFTISLKKDPSEGRCVLILSNTGEPFPERVGLDNPDTLGMQLITTLVSQLRGTLDLRRAPCPQFTIKFFE